MKNTYNQVYVWCCEYANEIYCQVLPVNDYELLNIEDFSFLMFWKEDAPIL